MNKIKKNKELILRVLNSKDKAITHEKACKNHPNVDMIVI